MKAGYEISRYAVVGIALLFFAVIVVGVGLRLHQIGKRNQAEPEPPPAIVVQVEPVREPHVEPEPVAVEPAPFMEGDGEVWRRIVVTQEQVARSAGHPVRPARELPQLEARVIGGDARRHKVPVPERRPWNPTPPPDSVRIALP